MVVFSFVSVFFFVFFFVFLFVCFVLFLTEEDFFRVETFKVNENTILLQFDQTLILAKDPFSSAIILLYCVLILLKCTLCGAIQQ